jgi:hypothetical protein
VGLYVGADRAKIGQHGDSNDIGRAVGPSHAVIDLANLPVVVIERDCLQVAEVGQVDVARVGLVLKDVSDAAQEVECRGWKRLTLGT